MGFEGIVFLLLGIAAFAITARAFIIVYQFEEGVRFRYGRYLSKLPPGPNFLIPLIDVVSIVDMRIRSMEVPPQKVVTSDNAVVMIEAVIYYRPIDAEKIILHVAQYEKASVLLSQTSLRAIVGEMIFDNLNSEREYLNRRLKESLDRLAESWGIMIISAEIGEVNPASKSLFTALMKQVRAERLKRAAILESEGRKASAILYAEGEKFSTQTIAGGQAKAKINVSRGEAEGIGIVAREADGITGTALSLWELNMWKTVSSSKNTTCVLPYNITDWIKCMRGIEGEV